MEANGRLKYLEVHNFKSYKGTQRIGPFKKFSCIIGPNGSGKSNLVDAISFVLGVKATHLRGSQLKDLIFRVEGESTKANSCYVKLVYVSSDGEETEFMRAISTSEAEATFSINGRTKSWEAYNEALGKLNIIVKAKNFLVFQGDVESIATKSPKALTELFEEISGSIEYKDRYEKLLAKKEQAEENTRFNEKKRKGINAEKIQFDQQMTEAEKYAKLVKRKKDLTLEYMLLQLYHIKQDLTKHQKVLIAHRKKLGDLQSERLKLNQSLSTKKKSQVKYRKQGLKIEQQIRKLRREIDKQRPDLINTSEEIDHITRRIASMSKSHQNKEHNLELHQQLIEELQTKLENVKAESASFEENMAIEESEDVQLSGRNLTEFNEKKGLVAKEVAKEVAQVEQLSREQRLKEQSRDTMVAQQKEYEQRLEQMKERKQQLSERLGKVGELQESCKTKKEDLENQLVEYRKQTKIAEKKKETLARKIEEIQAELRERKADIRESKRDQRLKDLLKNLTRLFPSVRGRLIDLVEPRERYELAVTVTLGKNMDAIIVDDEKTAIECLNYMKEQRLGTATFIPLDTIKVSPINEQFRQIDSSVKLVMEVMKYDHSFKRAVQYACGNAVVCETLEDAKQIAFGKSKRNMPKPKVVTVDGVLIRKSGLITGGVSTSLVSRARGWEQKDIDALKEKRDALINDLAEVGRTLRLKNKEELILNQISGLDTRLSYAEKDFTITQEKLESTQSDIANLTENLEDLLPSIEELNEQLEQRNDEIEELENVIKLAEDRIFGDFAERMGIEDIHEYEERHLRLAKEKAQKRMEFSNLISKLENQLQYEQSRNLEGSLTTDEQRIKDDKKALELLRNKYAKLKKTLDKAESQVATHQKSLETIKNTINKKDSDVDEVKKQIDELMDKMGKVQKQYAMAEGIIDQCRVKRHNIYQTCKVEEIWDMMPIEEDSDEEMDLNSDDEEQTSQSQYEDEDKIIVSFRKISSQMKQSGNFEKYVQDFKNQLHSVSISIDEIDPNLKASIHLKRVKARLGKTKGDLTAARNASDEAARKFAEVQKARIAKFNASYQPIAEEIDTIYKALTAGSGGKPGGTAYLNVDNTQEPYLGGVRFHVMPPNKRFRDMEQLSGGEKTVAALSLLFAMHSIHPAPFFLLDEVDAALDKSNIAKVARYLQSRKRDIQFIVVSLQDRFYENADGLVGVMFDQNQRCSATLTLDLNQYNN